jgi:hypothetical protein
MLQDIKMNKQNNSSEFWFCPITKKDISEGLCLDIYYQRLEYFKNDVLSSFLKQYSLNKSELNDICDNCPNMPLKVE